MSIPIKKNKFSEDEYVNNNHQLSRNPNFEYNQNIYFKPPKKNKNYNQIIFSLGSQKSTSTISSENQNYNNNMLIYIPCLNCGSEILFDEIENHSMICTIVKDEILKNEKSKNEFKSINYKLIKLKEHILQIIQGKDNSLLKNEFIIFGKDLYNLISKNLNNTNNYTSLSSVAGNNISFIQEKTNDKLLNKVTESNNDDDNIIEKNSLNYSYHHFFTFKSQSNQNNENKNENDIKLNEQEKKDFYKKVLIMKFEKLHSTHLGQCISPKEIFNEAKKENISKENWDEFILNELQNPYKYTINKNKFNNYRIKSLNTLTNQSEN